MRRNGSNREENVYTFYKHFLFFADIFNRVVDVTSYILSNLSHGGDEHEH